MSNNHTNCPNCGAIIVPGEFKCSYCGTVHYDMSNIPLQEAILLTIKVPMRRGHQIITQKVICRGATIDRIGGYLFADNLIQESAFENIFTLEFVSLEDPLNVENVYEEERL